MKKMLFVAGLILAVQQNNGALANALDDHVAPSASAGARVCPPAPMKGHTQYFAGGAWHFAETPYNPGFEGAPAFPAVPDVSGSAASTSSAQVSAFTTPLFGMAPPPTPRKGYSEMYDRSTNSWSHVPRDSE